MVDRCRGLIVADGTVTRICLMRRMWHGPAGIPRIAGWSPGTPGPERVFGSLLLRRQHLPRRCLAHRFEFRRPKRLGSPLVANRAVDRIAYHGHSADAADQSLHRLRRELL